MKVSMNMEVLSAIKLLGQAVACTKLDKLGGVGAVAEVGITVKKVRLANSPSWEGQHEHLRSIIF